MKVAGYCSRWDFILKRCAGKTVLHLGCVGETDASVEQKIEAFEAKRVLHPHVAAVAREVTGVDLDAEAVERLRSRLGVRDMLIGDVEHLEQLDLRRTFDVVLCGDLLEHLSCPGRALAGINRFMTPQSELIVSTPNSFALLANLRFTMARFQEGAQHVVTFSKFTLLGLLARHRFKVKELYTAYDRPAVSRQQRIQHAVGIPFFKMLPERGGTLLAVAQQEL